MTELLWLTSGGQPCGHIRHGVSTSGRYWFAEYLDFLAPLDRDRSALDRCTGTGPITPDRRTTRKLTRHVGSDCRPRAEPGCPGQRLLARCRSGRLACEPAPLRARMATRPART